MQSFYIEQSRRFNSDHRIPEHEKIAYGYRDGGRHVQFAETGEIISRPSREIIVVKSPADDPVFAQAISKAKIDMANLPSLEEKARYLHDYVTWLMHQNDPDLNEKIMDQILGGDHTGQEISLGQLIESRTGVCRHRSLLFKVLADETGIPAAIVRGNYDDGSISGGHAWNEVLREDGSKILVDVMHGFAGNLDHPKVKNYRDIYNTPMYDHLPSFTPAQANTIVGYQNWLRIEKGNLQGAEVNVHEWPEDKRLSFLHALNILGVDANIVPSSAQNGQLVVRAMGNENINRIGSSITDVQNISVITQQNWFNVNDRDGNSSKYLDVTKIPLPTLQTLQRAMETQGITYAFKESSLNGGMQVLATDAAVFEAITSKHVDNSPSPFIPASYRL